MLVIKGNRHISAVMIMLNSLAVFFHHFVFLLLNIKLFLCVFTQGLKCFVCVCVHACVLLFVCVGMCMHTLDVNTQISTVVLYLI